MAMAANGVARNLLFYLVKVVGGQKHQKLPSRAFTFLLLFKFSMSNEYYSCLFNHGQLLNLMVRLKILGAFNILMLSKTVLF